MFAVQKSHCNVSQSLLCELKHRKPRIIWVKHFILLFVKIKTIQAAVTIDWILPEKSGFLQNSLQEKNKTKTKQQTELLSTALPD